MKKINLYILFFINSFCAMGQDISGSWYGLLKAQGVEIRLVFNISKTDQGYSSTVESPDKGTKVIPASSTLFENGKLKLEVASAKIVYKGSLDQNNVFTGEFKQAGYKFPLTMSKEKIVLNRPQEPKEPFPYYVEEVIFKNEKGNFNLAGTLTLPQKEGIFPVVILISGSGPQNRDEELLGHKPFLIIADHLTRNGIGVLRYDDRGTAKSEGDFKSATTADLSTDAEAALNYLKTRKDVDPKKIGLAGHSEGGVIAPIVAANSADVAFIALLAGPGIMGDELLLMQQELIERASGTPEKDIKKMSEISKKALDIIKENTDDQDRQAALTEFRKKEASDFPSSIIPKGMSKEEFLDRMLKLYASPWMVYFLKYNPATTLEKVKCPVLAINGDKDVQVPSKINLEGIQNALKQGGNEQVTIKELSGLNHMFQECTTCAAEEYSKIEQTCSPMALNIISDWIKQQVK